MGTRSKLYRNPSLAYTYRKAYSLSSVLENLQNYNVITGNAPEPLAADDDPKPRPKRRRPPTNNNRRQFEFDNAPMSHQDYVRKLRKEACAAQSYEELTPPCSGFLYFWSSAGGLWDYGSDSDDGLSGPEESLGQPTLGLMEQIDGIKTQTEQRFPLPGEPVCVICGRYGEYICDECSTSGQASSFSTYTPNQPSETPESREDIWDHDHNRWSRNRTCLSTYECWKCNKPGHLAEDCLVTKHHGRGLKSHPACSQGAVQHIRTSSISANLRELYRRCHQINKNMTSAKCNLCCNSTSLATCLECSTIFCDSAGHLYKHVSTHLSPQTVYSHKLRRLVKCCKSTCEVTNIRELFFGLPVLL